MKKISEYGKLQREIRNKEKISIRALSEKSGVSHSYLSQVENGTRDTPSPEIISKIANALNYDYFTMMRTAGYMESEKSDEIKTEEILHSAPMDFIEKFLKVDGVLGFRLPPDLTDKELRTLFIDRFNKYGLPGDWAKLIRMHKKLSHEEVVKKSNNWIDDDMGISEGLLKNFEENDIVPDMGKLILIGSAYGIDNFYLWLRNNVNKPLYTEDLEDYGITPLEEVKINISFQVPAYVKEIDENQVSISRPLSEEEAKEKFLRLENLLTMDENIYLNERIMTKEDKEKALSILMLIFD